MKKITLIFLLFANMIASGQISRIRLDMQLIDTINNDVSYKFIGTNNEDILCLSDENGLFDFLVDSTYNENSYIFFHKNPKDTLYLKDLKAFESNNMDGYIVKLLKIETFTKEEFEKYAKKNSLIPERQEYTLLPSTKIEESSSLKLHLSVEQDTLYAEETLTLSFSLSTDRWLPNRIILNPESFEVVNTKESVLPNGIHVSIKHNGEKYEEPLPVIVRRLKPLKYWIAKYHHVLIEQEIRTPINRLFNARMWNTAKDIFDTEMSNEEKEEKFRKIQNRNFGEYEIQGIFVTEFNDTIRSEVKKIWYLEK